MSLVGRPLLGHGTWQILYAKSCNDLSGFSSLFSLGTAIELHRRASDPLKVGFHSDC